MSDSRHRFIEIVLTFILTMSLGYVLGLSVLNVVDNRLNDISINMPKIKLPKQTIHVDVKAHHDVEVANKFDKSELNVDTSPPQITNNLVEKESTNFVETQKEPELRQNNFIEAQKQPEKLDHFELAKLTEKLVQTGGKATGEKNHCMIDPKKIETENKKRIDNDMTNGLAIADSTKHLNQCQPLSHKISEFEETPANYDLNLLHGNKKLGEERSNDGCAKSIQCLNKEKCQKSFYKDTSEMTRPQLNKFKYKAKLDKMTGIDYTRWLKMYIDTPYELSINHAEQFNRIQRGEVLETKDIPLDRSPRWPNSQEFYEDMYGDIVTPIHPS